MQQNTKTYNKLHIHIDGYYRKRLNWSSAAIPDVKYTEFQNENLFPATQEGMKKTKIEILQLESYCQKNHGLQ